MTPAAVFLRGVNVGGKGIISMPELKTLLRENGFNEVQTFLNSGNITLKSGLHPEQIKKKIEGLLKKYYPFPMDIFIRTYQELKTVLSQDPFRKEQGLDNSKKCIAFLSESPQKERVAALAADTKIEERYFVIEDVIFIYYDNGIEKSYFSNGFIEKRLNVRSTTRNWNTLAKVIELMKT